MPISVDIFLLCTLVNLCRVFQLIALSRAYNFVVYFDNGSRCYNVRNVSNVTKDHMYGIDAVSTDKKYIEKFFFC